jgi:hypothetical protein
LALILLVAAMIVLYEPARQDRTGKDFGHRDRIKIPTAQGAAQRIKIDYTRIARFATPSSQNPPQ